MELIATFWPNLVVESFDDDHEQDVFVYDCQASKESWDDEGSTETNCDNMIQVISQIGSLTVVHDGNDAIVEKIKEVLNG